MTTPESLDLQGLFYRMAEDRVSHVVMEVSSHALALERIAGCEFTTGVFTNLSQDHLDFHATMEEYFAAKKLLFSNYLTSPFSAAAINVDDAYGARLIENGACRPARVIGYSAGPWGNRSQGPNRFCAKSQIQPLWHHRHSPYARRASNHRIRAHGKLNLYNILAAISAAVSLDLSPGAIEEGIRRLSRVDGRLEREEIPERCGFQVVVDYAHTPDGMQKALACIREMTQKRLIAVFGCGGDRDRKKRSIMGEVAGRLADIVILTSDNPRSESPEVILDQIEEGVKRTSIPFLAPDELAPAPKGCFRKADRREAIESLRP